MEGWQSTLNRGHVSHAWNVQSENNDNGCNNTDARQGRWNDFERSIQAFLASSDDDLNVRYHIGIVAYIPAYVEREAKQRDLADKSVSSEWIGNKNEAVLLEIEIISKRQATAWAGYNVSAITSDGNRVSFFTGKDDVATKEGMFKVSAKVKDHGRVWRDESTKETRLNYVKLI